MHSTPTAAAREPLNAVYDAHYWNDLITTREAAAYLGLSSRRLEALRYLGGSPKFLALSQRCIRYRRSDLLAWVEERSRRNTSEARRDARDLFGRGDE